MELELGNFEEYFLKVNSKYQHFCKAEIPPNDPNDTSFSGQFILRKQRRPVFGLEMSQGIATGTVDGEENVIK